MRPIIYPYKTGSRSARALTIMLHDLRSKRVREDGRYRPYRNHTIINWGNPRVPGWWNETAVNNCLNLPTYVEAAGNKLSAFRIMEAQGVSVVPYTDDREVALGWAQVGRVVISRRLLRGSGGDGIGVHEAADDVPNAPLYTRYVKKRNEYRVHVFNNEVIHVSEKRRMGAERRPDGFEDRIRNHNLGWVFCHNDVNPHRLVLEQSIAACRALELDFGAVDVIWNEHYGRAYVLEVNTAPGLEGVTVTKYVDAIRGVL